MLPDESYFLTLRATPTTKQIIHDKFADKITKKRNKLRTKMNDIIESLEKEINKK